MWGRMRTAGSRTCWSRVLASACAAFSLGLTSPNAQAASAVGDAQTIDFVWRLACNGIEQGPDEDRIRAARGCAAALEEVFDANAIHMVLLYLRIANEIADGGRVTNALPYRQKAYDAALRVVGPDQPMTGKIALEYAQGLIASARYATAWARASTVDPEIDGALRAALRGFNGAAPTERYRAEGYRWIATAYADAGSDKFAIAVMQALPEQTVFKLSPRDWEKLGQWRQRSGDLAGAADAYRAALNAEPDPASARRLQALLQRTGQ